MARVQCALCGREAEERSMERCSECLSYLCADCAYENNGKCSECAYDDMDLQ